MCYIFAPAQTGKHQKREKLMVTHLLFHRMEKCWPKKDGEGILLADVDTDLGKFRAQIPSLDID